MRSPLQAARIALIVLATVLSTSAANTDSHADVPEPEGLWTGPMHGQTPKTLTGAVVLDLPALEALMAQKPVLLDVGPADKKPDDFPEDGLWLPTHRSMPGAVWMPGAGAASLDSGKEEALYRRIDELTQGDKTRPIVTFCKPQCWGSWNVGKRLVMKGYTRVGWFPAGIDAWQDRHESVVVEAEAGWEAKPPK